MFGEKKRIAMCIHCGKGVEYSSKDKSARKDAWQEMKQHDAMCPDNPLVSQRNQLRAALDGLHYACVMKSCRAADHVPTKRAHQEAMNKARAALKATEEG